MNAENAPMKKKRTGKAAPKSPAAPPFTVAIVERPDDGSTAERWNEATAIIMEAGRQAEKDGVDVGHE
jgi:hypothetical protein